MEIIMTKLPNVQYYFLVLLLDLNYVESDLFKVQNVDYYSMLSRTGLLTYHPLSKYIVSLKSQDNETSYAEHHLCAGVIVSARAVVTAHHCLLDKEFKPLDLKNLLVAGGFTLGSIEEKTVQKFPVEKLIFHPDFKRKTYTNDLAIILIKGFFNFTPKTVDKAAIGKEQRPSRSVCNLVGFGVISFNNVKLNMIMDDKLKIWPENLCDTYLEKHQIDRNGKFCIGDPIPNEKPCTNLASEIYICGHTAYGVSLFKISCDQKLGFASVLIDLSYYKDWISENAAGPILLSHVNARCVPSKAVGIICIAVLIMSTWR